jgi:hypothetical protein
MVSRDDMVVDEGFLVPRQKDSQDVGEEDVAILVRQHPVGLVGGDFFSWLSLLYFSMCL